MKGMDEAMTFEIYRPNKGRCWGKERYVTINKQGRLTFSKAFIDSLNLFPDCRLDILFDIELNAIAFHFWEFGHYKYRHRLIIPIKQLLETMGIIVTGRFYIHDPDSDCAWCYILLDAKEE